MDIGERIKHRREELHMTQDELAIKVGYKSRSSVNKIEIDGRGLPQKKIVAFAKALETTPAYLMGWEDNLTEDNAEITVRMLQHSNIIDIVRILLKHDDVFIDKVLEYVTFLEMQNK